MRVACPFLKLVCGVAPDKVSIGVATWQNVRTRTCDYYKRRCQQTLEVKRD